MILIIIEIKIKSDQQKYSIDINHIKENSCFYNVSFACLS